jgi:RNA polymerase sigma factor (sigma-70 family)
MATAAPEISVLARDRAFESLYRQYVKDVYHYALALLRNPADAEDVTQTTFLNAYRAYSRGVEVEKPQNWLIKIAHNVARTRYARSSRRVKEVPLEDHVEQLAVPEENKPDVQGVLEALGRLPFNQRAALVMRELEGRNYSEIADTIGVSVSAVETLIFRARRSLRLKASALRSLAVVPLPSSLTQFFGSGGGLVVGGGGAVAGGFVAKAAIAIVAGLIATGINTDRTGPASAARDGGTQSAVGESWSRAQGDRTSATGQPGVKEAPVGVRNSRADGVVVGQPGARDAGQPATAAGTAATTIGSPVASAANAAQSPVVTSAVETAAAATQPVTTTTQPVTQTVTSAAQPVVSTVEKTVSNVTAAVPVPVPKVPSPPPLPVKVPPVPGGSPLP